MAVPFDIEPVGEPGTSAELPIIGQPRERCDALRNRRRILAAAGEIVAAHGAEGLSMNALAVAAGVGKGTIFRRFGDRDGLLLALLHEDTIALQNEFLSGPPPLGPGAPAAERLEAFVVAWIRFEAAHLELLLAAEQGHVGADNPALTSLRLHVSWLVEQIDPRLEAPLVAELVLNSVSARVIRRAYRGAGDSTVALERAAIALLRGITDPGTEATAWRPA
jgi:AcrR family transcriptional regulator